MNRTKVAGLIIVIAVAAGVGVDAQAKTWTVDQRQAKLMQDINAAQKSKAISAKQAKKLRGQLADVARAKAKMMAKTQGKLTPEDAVKVQDKIDGVSSNIKDEIREAAEARAKAAEKAAAKAAK